MSDIEYERWLIKRVEELEAALREIRKLAREPQGKGWNLGGLHGALSRIENKCREALATGEGE